MNKKEFIDSIAIKCEFSKKDAEKAVNAVLETLENALKRNEKVVFTGFGSFEPVEKPARRGINPATGKKIKIPKRKTVRFRAGKKLKEILNTE
jgi:DNA-binding protein HU-beta